MCKNHIRKIIQAIYRALSIEFNAINPMSSKYSFRYGTI